MSTVRRMLRGVSHAAVLVLALLAILFGVSALPAFLGLIGIVFPDPSMPALVYAITRFVFASVCIMLLVAIGRVME